MRKSLTREALVPFPHPFVKISSFPQWNLVNGMRLSRQSKSFHMKRSDS